MAHSGAVSPEHDASSLSVTWKEILGVLAALAAVLVPLEWKYRYFFLQDDNRDFALPWLVHAWRGLQQGELALYNFHQFSGYPSLGSAQTGSLYPPGYLAVLLSQTLFGHVFASVDILVILHLALGVVGWLFFFRRLGLGATASVWGALACDLNSFVIFGGSSWLCISVLAAWFPWMLYFGLEFLHGPAWWKWAGLLVARLLLFYHGYVQYFFYGAVLEMLVLAAVWFAWPETIGRPRRRFILTSYLASWIYVTLLAAPLLLPMWRQVETSAARRGPVSFAEFIDARISWQEWRNGMLDPFDYLTPSGLGEAFPYLGHVGYLTILGVLVALYLALRNKSGPERRRLTVVLAVLAELALLLSTGAFAETLYQIPVYNRFRWPFKTLVFANYFEVALAALAVDYVMSMVARPWRRRATAGLCLALILINFMVLYIGYAPKPFRTHTEPVPLEEPMRETLRDGKILGLGLPTFYSRGMAFDYATLWGLYHFAGYDPLVPQENSQVALRLQYFATAVKEPQRLPMPWLRQWGVRWYLVSSQRPDYETFLQAQGLAMRSRDFVRSVYFDPEAKPLVFWEDGRTDPVDWQILTNSIRLHVSCRQAGRLCLNFLWHKRFQVLIDGGQGSLQANNYGQMVLDVPAGEHSMIVRYRDPDFQLGLLIAAAGVAALAVHGMLGARRS